METMRIQSSSMRVTVHDGAYYLSLACSNLTSGSTLATHMLLTGLKIIGNGSGTMLGSPSTLDDGSKDYELAIYYWEPLVCIRWERLLAFHLECMLSNLL